MHPGTRAPQTPLIAAMHGCDRWSAHLKATRCGHGRAQCRGPHRHLHGCLLHGDEERKR